MAEKKAAGGIMTLDPEAQKYVRDLTRPHVENMIKVLVGIAMDRDSGTRDRAKAAARVIDYHVAGQSVLDDHSTKDGRPMVLVVNGSDVREMDEASDELRRLTKLTQASKN